MVEKRITVAVEKRHSILNSMNVFLSIMTCEKSNTALQGKIDLRKQCCQI